MDAQTIKILGIVALLLAAVCVFAAVERYIDNANKVNAMNQMMSGSPFGAVSPLGRGPVRPAVPAVSKYCALFAVLLGAGGAFALVKAKQMRESPPEGRE